MGLEMVCKTAEFTGRGRWPGAERWCIVIINWNGTRVERSCEVNGLDTRWFI